MALALPEYQLNRTVAIQSFRWFLLRTRLLCERGERCERCQTEDEPFTLHHLTYEHVGHEFDEEVVLLCKTCHRQAHNGIAIPFIERTQPDWPHPPCPVCKAPLILREIDGGAHTSVYSPDKFPKVFHWHCSRYSCIRRDDGEFEYNGCSYAAHAFDRNGYLRLNITDPDDDSFEWWEGIFTDFRRLTEVLTEDQPWVSKVKQAKKKPDKPLRKIVVTPEKR